MRTRYWSCASCRVKADKFGGGGVGEPSDVVVEEGVVLFAKFDEVA